MRGRKPIPAHLKIIRGNPGKYPIPQEPEPQIPPTIPDPPDFLTPIAKFEWYRIAPELYRLHLLTIADLNPLAAYCQAYARWQSAEEALARVAERDPAAAGLVIRSANHGPMANPLVKIAASAARDMVKYAIEFGLTPTARARIAAGGYQRNPEQEFAGLLAG